MLDATFEQFVQMSPVTVMARGLMERIFAPERMDRIFASHAKVQYQRELLFSSQVDLMSLVVNGVHKSVYAAYKAKALKQTISTTALYNKLNGVEIGVSQAVLRETATELQQLIQNMGGEQPNPCPGYEIRIIDGNCLAGTDHRLDAIRLFAAKALPGKMLVVLDPISKLVVDIFPIEDGHAQERSRFEVLAVVKPNQIWIGDRCLDSPSWSGNPTEANRNFCTAEFLTTIAKRSAFFVIRQHGSLGWKEVSELKANGQTDTGDIFEQLVEICYQGKTLKCRRVVIKLFKPTRDQEQEIAILTNLSPQVADTACIAQLYRNRWSVETLFQTVTENLNGEIQTLAYPKAALFSLAMAFATYNILATIRAALGSVHGTGKVEAGLSDYYLVDEIQGLYRGMMISIPPPHWQVFHTFSIEEMGSVLQHCAHYVNLKRFLKATRGEKKKRPPLIVNSKHRHVSTARCLENHQP
jgi:Transposase DDE domain